MIGVGVADMGGDPLGCGGEDRMGVV